MISKKSLSLVIVTFCALGYVLLVELAPTKVSWNEFIFRDLDKEEIVQIKVENEFGSFSFINPHPKAVSETADEVELNPDVYQDWYLSDLPKARIDKSALADFVSAVLQLRMLEPFALEGGLEQYGLAPAGLKVELKHLTGSHLIEVGDKSNYLDAYYVRIDGKELFLTDGTLVRFGSKAEADFRERYLISEKSSDILGVKIRFGFNEISLKREIQGWFIEEPDFFPVDPESINILLKTLVNLKTETFFDLRYEQLDHAGLQHPSATFEVKTRHGTKTIILSELPDDNYRENIFAYVQGEMFFSLLDRVMLGKFPVSLFDLRKKSFLDLDLRHVQEIKIEKRGLLPIFLEKQGEKWLVNRQESDEPFINKFLEKLAFLKATDFIDYKDSVSFDNHLLRIVVKRDDGTKAVLLVADKKNKDGLFYVLGTAASEPYLISEADLRGISPSAEMFYKVIPIQEE